MVLSGWQGTGVGSGGGDDPGEWNSSLQEKLMDMESRGGSRTKPGIFQKEDELARL